MSSRDLSATPLLSLWLLYKSHMPRGAGPEQIKQTRRAFYSGAGSMFHLMSKLSTSMKEEKAMELMSTIANEIEAFYETVGTGDDQN